MNDPKNPAVPFANPSQGAEGHFGITIDGDEYGFVISYFKSSDKVRQMEHWFVKNDKLFSYNSTLSDIVFTELTKKKLVRYTTQWRSLFPFYLIKRARLVRDYPSSDNIFRDLEDKNINDTSFDGNKYSTALWEDNNGAGNPRKLKTLLDDENEKTTVSRDGFDDFTYFTTVYHRFDDIGNDEDIFYKNATLKQTAKSNEADKTELGTDSTDFPQKGSEAKHIAFETIELIEPRLVKEHWE